MSLTFVVFLIVPILAPSLGQLILFVAPWRFIFVVFAIFAAVVAGWGYFRLPETLHPEYRLSLTRKHILNAAKLVLGTRASIFYTLAMMVMFGTIMAYVGMVAQIFADVFHQPKLMHSQSGQAAKSQELQEQMLFRFVVREGGRRQRSADDAGIDTLWALEEE